MTKMQIKISPKITVEIEGETHIQLFDQMVSLSEVFGVEKCERCGGTDLKFNIRRVDKYTYYELCCLKEGCWARLSFGQYQDPKLGFLYPRVVENEKGSVMNLEQGDRLPHGGWLKYSKEKGNH